MKKAMAITAVTAVCGLGVGLAISAATFARADDERVESAAVIPARVTSATTPSVTPPSTTPAAPSPSVTSSTPASDGLRARRLVVARGVENHEPVGAFEVLASRDELDRVFAFVELENRGDARAEVVVTFEHESGFVTGHVTLEVPERTRRWRTWAFTRNVDRAGQWRAVVRDRDGRVLDHSEFEVRR